MIDHSVLDQAVARGILDAGQRQALIDLASEIQADSASSGEGNGRSLSGGLSVDDQMRLVGGGNDIFVAVGIILLFAGGQFALAAMFPGGRFPSTIALIVASWLVAEVITRQKRMRLSSTLLALIFTVAIFILLANLLRDRIMIPGETNAFSLFALRSEAGQIALFLGGGLIAAAAAYFARFKVPVLAGVIATAATGLAFLGAIVFYHDQLLSGAVAAPRPDQLADILADALAIPLLCGLTIFIAAVLLDLRDRERQTVWSDCAFWLHVVSAPLLVHPLFILATGQEILSGEIEPGVGAGILLGVMMTGFVLVALAIDRRSLLAPTLAYFGSVGIYYLVNDAANTTGIPPFALILIAIGAMVILFGAGWQRIRRLIIRPLLPTSVLDRLPPIKA
jgi:MFS family permease